ncbi:MAG: 50S ribosomal protein L21 [Dehalococcoidia bacterium]|nr:MAG: 50S ribosomal protein L21 [Dehalococcoidia bacterium]
MYAIVDAGGHQVKVRAGQVLDVDRRDLEPGATVEFEKVLLLADGPRVTVGQPTVAGAKVTGTVLREVKGEKIVVFKYKPKVRYRRRLGHRQRYTRVRIDSIVGGN